MLFITSYYGLYKDTLIFRHKIDVKTVLYTTSFYRVARPTQPPSRWQSPLFNTTAPLTNARPLPSTGCHGPPVVTWGRDNTVNA